MNNTEDKIRTIKVRIAGYLTLFFLLGFIVSLIVTIATCSYDENNQAVYSPLGLSINMIFTFLTAFGLIVFLILYTIRFVKRTKGPALEMKEKEKFLDDKEKGSLIEKVTPSKLPYSLSLAYHLYSFRKDVITLISLMVLSLGLGLYFYLSQVEVDLAYALFILFVLVTILFTVILCLPLLQKKKDEIKEYEIYQDKFLYSLDKEIPEELYYSSITKAKETPQGYYFSFYRNGSQVLFVLKKDIKEDSQKFLSLKVKQIYNYNHQGLKN